MRCESPSLGLMKGANNDRAQNGKYGSIGYRYPWSSDESLRLVLRTHTTSVSANLMYKLASMKGPDGRPPPARLFSIDRVFRNETVDATHLAEFHQVEGVIADYGLTLGGLMEVGIHPEYLRRVVKYVTNRH